MVEVIHKGETTTWMTNIVPVIPILKELNPAIREWSTVPPLYDIWIYYWSRCYSGSWGDAFSETASGSMSTSPIYGIPPVLQCTSGLSQGVLRELVPQVISVPYDPSSVKYEAKPVVNVILRNRVKQEGDHRNASHVENNIPNVPVVPEALLHVCPKISDSPNRKQRNHSKSQRPRTRRTSPQR